VDEVGWSSPGVEFLHCGGDTNFKNSLYCIGSNLNGNIENLSFGRWDCRQHMVCALFF
jgi:hypothetical protein